MNIYEEIYIVLGSMIFMFMIVWAYHIVKNGSAPEEQPEVNDSEILKDLEII